MKEKTTTSIYALIKYKICIDLNSFSGVMLSVETELAWSATHLNTLLSRIKKFCTETEYLCLLGKGEKRKGNP